MRIFHKFGILTALSIIALTAHSEERHGEAIHSNELYCVALDTVTVTGYKNASKVEFSPTSVSVLDAEELQERGITAVKQLSGSIPNLHIPDYGSRMTSSIYVRGIGSRIDQPAVGLNVDNVAIMSKDNYDLDVMDIERIEVLRGAQSTLYGRNTMGGVINIYTLSPLRYEGIRAGVEYGSGNRIKFRASAYNRINKSFGISVGGYYSQSNGMFKNSYTNRLCDWDKQLGTKIRLDGYINPHLKMENQLAFSWLKQGGYPYANLESGKIAYNDPTGYNRTSITLSSTLTYNAPKYTLTSVTAYQYSEDDMRLDQDFLPESYFNLQQAKQEHCITEEILFKSANKGVYKWTAGAFLFFKQSDMNAPVTFLEKGIDQLILKHLREQGIEAEWQGDTFPLGDEFLSPTFGGAIYHQSQWDVGRWSFTAALRLDAEKAILYYHTFADAQYKTRTDATEEWLDHSIQVDERRTLSKLFFNVIPKVSVTYRIGGRSDRTLYAVASRGYKAGGFNNQMFSEVLQQKIMKQMGIGSLAQVDQIISYKPERSWNYEVGCHISAAKGALGIDASLFYIDCRDQQVTVFPEGQTTGRMMANAGKSCSCGGEFALRASIGYSWELGASYGYTNAKFVEFNNGKSDFSGKYVPYAPQHTSAIRLEYTIFIGTSWFDKIKIGVDAEGLGPIYWNESNTVRQDFYPLLNASLRLVQDNAELSFRCRNLTRTRYDVFYFMSMGNEFVQRGYPTRFDIALDINF